MAGRTLSPRVPSLRLHRPSGQAVCTLGGRDYYLGKHGTPEARAEYDRLIAEFLARGRVAPPMADGATDLSVNEVIAAYLVHVDAYYRKDGRPTVEAGNIRLAVRPLRKLYGHTEARRFGPLALKAVREAMIEADNCRREINRRVGRIVRLFKWAVSEELVPAPVHQALTTVPPLKAGRTSARESAPVAPVAPEHVAAVLPLVSRQVAAMIELQNLAAMRPGEVVAMTTGRIDTTGAIWTYRPESHKGQHNGRDRVVFLGPQAQAVLKGWMRPDEPDRPLFSPAEATAERRDAMRAARRTRVQPSQADRRKARPKKLPGDRYTVGSYRHAIQAACAKAGIDPWHPHQLRHAAATAIRARFGLEASQLILGHARADVTQVYAERDQSKALAVAAEIG